MRRSGDERTVARKRSLVVKDMLHDSCTLRDDTCTTEGGGIPAALGPDPGAGIAHSGLPS
jgi:hypothetical protein